MITQIQGKEPAVRAKLDAKNSKVFLGVYFIGGVILALTYLFLMPKVTEDI